MKPLNYSKTKIAKKIEPGSILIAQPFLKDEILERGVILILEHNIMGAAGVLLNRKSNLSIFEVLPNLKIIKPLFYGGNFETKVVSYIHSNSSVPDSIRLYNNLFWGGNYEVISDLITNGKFNLKEINFFAGYVQWGSGQLEEEIQNNKWWVGDLKTDELFSVPSEDFWAFSLENYGHMYSLFGDIPDPSFN